MTKKIKSRKKNSVIQIFNPSPFFFFLLTGNTDINMLYTSFTGYEDAIFRGNFYLQPQRSKIGGKTNQFGEKSKKKIELRGVHGVCFSKSDRDYC